MKMFSRCLVGGACTAVLAAAFTLAHPVAPTASAAELESVANNAERKYKCTKCGQIFTFERPGNHKCPTCNKPLIPANR